jgi:hypothetical protein
MTRRASRGATFWQSLPTAGRACAAMAALSADLRPSAFYSEIPSIPRVAVCVSEKFCRGCSQSQWESTA